MRIEAVLFDTDGVIQKPAVDLRNKLGEMLGCSESVDESVSDVFAAERPALTGQSDFSAALSEVLTRRECSGTVD